MFLNLGRRSLRSYLTLVHRTDMPDVAEGEAAPAAHHFPMIVALEEEEGNVVIVEPRGAGKTKIGQGFCESTFGKKSLSGDPHWAERIRVLLLSHKATKAEEISLAIQNRISGDKLFQNLFPNVKPSSKWAVDQWRLKGNETGEHPNFQTGGIDSPPLGGRFDIIILDDIADAENMKTQAQRDKVRRTLEETIIPMLTPWGRIIMFGTRWAWEDPIAWAQERGWREVIQKALLEVKVVDEETGEERIELRSYWPERFSVEHLLHLRDVEMGPKAFAKQMQNEVAPEEGIVFERWWFDRRFDDLPADIAFRFESWDLASTTGRKSSYSVGTAFVVARHCPLCNGAPFHAFIPHMWRGKVGYGYLKRAIRTVYDLMGGYSRNHRIVIEKKNVGEAIHGEGLHDPLHPEKMYQLHFRSAVGEGQSDGMKDARILDAADFCAMGNVHLPSEAFLKSRTGSSQWLAEFEQEVFAYPEGGTTDIVSTLVQGIEEIEERRIKFQKILTTRQPAMQWGGGNRWERAQIA